MSPFQVHMTYILEWYDGPLLVQGIIPSDNREFVMVAIDNHKGLAVEISRQDMVGMLNNKITLRKIYTEKRIGPFYYGEMVGQGVDTELTEVIGEVPLDELPGDVMLRL